MEISLENLYKCRYWGYVYISFSIERDISAPENFVNLYSSFLLSFQIFLQIL